MRRRLEAAVVLLGIVAGVSCSAIVGNSLPAFTCDPDHVDTCPIGMTCDTATSQCVTESAGKPDREAPPGDDDDDPLPEAGIPDGNPLDAPANDSGVGPCRTDLECTSRICGDKSLLTPPVVDTTGPVCTTTCCTSADCPTGEVCFGSGTGGNYCVAAAEVDRKVPGTGEPGSACAGDGTKCRSGSCIANKCIDTCCKNADCKGGLVCKLQDFSGHFAYACGTPSGTTNDGEECFDSSDCKSGFCYAPSGTKICRPTCCNDTACPAGRCIFDSFSASGDAIRFCFYNSSGALPGTACDTDGECRSAFCDPDSKKCAELCCVDTDCKPGFACRPSSVGRRNTHCVPK